MVIRNKEFCANLLVFDTHGFDLILKMDQFKTFYAVIYYQNRSIIFRVSKHTKLQFIEHNSQIEPLEIRVCPMEVILTHLDANLVKVPVVSKFVDVFEDLLGLQPDKVAEFLIDLISCTSPISKASYQIGPIEVQKS